jgi:hypothetical protein
MSYHTCVVLLSLNQQYGTDMPLYGPSFDENFTAFDTLVNVLSATLFGMLADKLKLIISKLSGFD